jgi:ATP-dependent Clp protease protease subunit
MRIAAQRLFDARTLLVCGEITMDTAREVVSQALALAAASDDPITVWVHSPGGHVESSDTIHDAHIFLAAEREDRYCLPNTRFLLHQPLGGIRGRATDMEIEANEIIKMRARLNRIIAEKTGQPLKRWRRTPSATSGCRQPKHSSTAW